MPRSTNCLVVLHSASLSSTAAVAVVAEMVGGVQTKSINERGRQVGDKKEKATKLNNKSKLLKTLSGF